MKKYDNSISLVCDQVVHVDQFFVETTYAGMLCGVPDKEMNDGIIANSLTIGGEDFGDRKTHLIQPTVITSPCGAPVLPKYTCKAWLVSYKPIKKGDGSELVVVWFAWEVFNRPVRALIANAVIDLPWNDLAEDFEF